MRTKKKKSSSKRKQKKSETREVSPVDGRGCLWWKRFRKQMPQACFEFIFP